MAELYDAESHRAQLEADADLTYRRVFAESGALKAYWARRRVYGYLYPGISYSRVGRDAGRCDRPMGAPITEGSIAEDIRYGVIFTIDHVESHMGDSTVKDTSGRWHEIENVRVIEWCSPEDLRQRKQDRILARLEAAYGL